MGAAGRRNTELGLLLLAAMVVIGAFVLMSLAEGSDVPPLVTTVVAGVLAVQLVGHIAIRKLAPYADPTIWPIVTLLNGLGFVFIVRIDAANAPPIEGEEESAGGWGPFAGLADFAGMAGQQALWIVVGAAIFVGTLWYVRETKVLERYRYTAGLAGLLLVVLPLLPGIGRSVNGARIWVAFGPFNLQPGEFAKLALCIFFAGYLYEKREMLAMTRKFGALSLPDPKYMAPLLLAWGFAMLVMLRQNELGTSLLLFTLFTVLIWVATERTAYLAISLTLFFGGTWFAFSNFLHAQRRMEMWNGLPRISCGGGNGLCRFEGDLTTANGTEQVDQGAYALGEGGLGGVGLGLGSPELIPEVETDFIFTAFGEELGLFGTTALLLAFLLLVGTGLRIAQQQTTSGFDRLLAVGLTTLIGFQTFVIIAGVTQLLPLTGITLPFVSYGGSSLLANYVLVALLLRMSDSTARTQAEEQAGGEMTTIGQAI